VKSSIESDFAMIVPAGARHNVKNTGATAPKLYTIYAPPEHAEGTVRATKADADAHEEHFNGTTTE
jgi:mannose-6-phosphate isomerase-like protein (cupin superfamily)